MNVSESKPLKDSEYKLPLRGLTAPQVPTFSKVAGHLISLLEPRGYQPLVMVLSLQKNASS